MKSVHTYRLSKLLTILFLLLILPLHAAPLYPDVADGHWAADAVSALIAKGLLDGYPDGTFKGDRSTSRWEVALLVARLLEKMETGNLTFAGKHEKDEVRVLAIALRNELEALGVRADNLEESTSLLSKRMDELERITFYGSLDTRVVMQSFRNAGSSDNDSLRGGFGLAGSVPYIEYESAVGTALGPPWRPMIVGILPVVDYRNGKALTNGTGLTSLAILGMNVEVSDEVEAAAEFAAFSSVGDQVVDAYWGVSAPYLQNIFSANAGSTQGLNNQPFTRMTLNRFWVKHKPSTLKLTIGYIDHTDMDPLIYAGQGNLGVFGPGRWPGFGFDLTGASAVGNQKVTWEVMGSRFGDGVRFEGTNYQNYVLNGNLKYHFKNGLVGFNYSRSAEEAPTGGGPLTVGLDNGLNVAYGSSSGWSVRQWVNPPGWFALQRSAYEQLQTAKVGNTADTRPIPGWSPAQDNTAGYGAGAGNFGPESSDVWGLEGRYDVFLNESDKLLVETHFGHSDFRPNRNSRFNAGGNAFSISLNAALINENLALGVDYLRVDPRYSPSAWFGNSLGGRPIKPFNLTGVFHLYDSGRYPHNREGFQLQGKWKFDDDRGKLWGKAGFLKQVKTSLYDVRVTGGALGPFVPTNDVLGFSPGFVDTVFYGFAHPNLYGAGSANSFTSSLAPLENPKGYERNFELGASYRFASPGLTVSGSAARHEIERDSTLSPALGGSQNKVDLTIDSLTLDIGYELSQKLSVNGGIDYVVASGHYDPAGLYNRYAVTSGSTGFRNIDSYQLIPHAGLDYKINSTTTWDILARHYETHDQVDPSVQPGDPALGQIGSTTHPFGWEGWQVSSEFRLTF